MTRPLAKDDPTKATPTWPRHTPFAEPGSDTTELTTSRLMTLLPTELLQGGEAIVLLLKPSPWYILLESIHFLATLTVLLGLTMWVYNCGYNIGLTPREMALAGAGLAGVRLFWQFLEWLSRVYVLTDRRVIRVKGVIRVQVFECQLQQVQHTTTTFSLRERLFGLGSIHFATAGTGGVEASWLMLAKPLEVHQTVVTALNRYR